MENCHWLKTRINSREVIIKLPKIKNAKKILQVKKTEVVEFEVDGDK